MAPRASQDRPRCAQGLPRPSLSHLGASNGSAVWRFQKTCETRTPFFTFCFAVSFFLRLAVFVLSPQSAPRPQRSRQRAPGSSQGLPKAPLGALWAPNASRYLVFCVCVFCSLVSFIYCTSNTGSRVVNGQNAGPSARRESTFGRRFVQMPIGFLIFRVFLPPHSFFRVLHC